MENKNQHHITPQGIIYGSLSDSDTAALVDMDLHTQMSPDSVLGIDNVGLDFTDLDFIMDENSQKILNGILPESPPDSSSEHCLSSPSYLNSSLLSPPELTLNTHDLSSNLYHDPVMYQIHSPTDSYPIRHASLHDKPTTSIIPDLCTVDYSQPLQIVEQAQVQAGNFHGAHIKSTSLPHRLDPSQYLHNEGQIVTIPVRNQALKPPFSDQSNTRLTVRTGTFNGVNNNNNNNSVTFLSPNDRSVSGRSQIAQLDHREVPATVQETIKQEPIGSPPIVKQETENSSKLVNHRKKRRRENSFVQNDDSDTSIVQQPVKIKSETECDQTTNVQFMHFEPLKWSYTCSPDFKKLQTPLLKVSADKGFNFSQLDDAFIAQKKNHFQLTCHVVKDGQHDFISTESGYKQIEYLQLNFYGVKKEAPDQKIQIEQSQTDRSRKRFFPIKLSFRGDQPMKVSVGRLHFSETTLNNMRKKGRPNPEQRYFQLVVALEAVYGVNSSKVEVPLYALATERIIVRASNPGLFEPEQDVSWSKHPISDTVFHLGKVAVGTDQSNEALTVQGNIQVAGEILHPSDKRIKQNIALVDPKKQLENLQKIQVVEYQYKPEYLARFNDVERAHMSKKQTGVIAQDLRKILPDAVESAGDIVLNSGTEVNNMLIVNKDRLFLENIGAVRELSKVTDNLGHRIEELESHTVRMSRLTRFGSVKSSASLSTNSSSYKSKRSRSEGSLFRNRWIQGAILVLVGIMTLCLLAMATLYILEYQRRLVDDEEFPIMTENVTSATTTIPVPTGGMILTTKLMRSTTMRGKITTHMTTQRPYPVTLPSPRRPRRIGATIGKPHDCLAPDAQRQCDSFCCLMDYTSVTGPELTLDDNNISSPGQAAEEAIEEVRDPVANVLDESDVTGIRETSEQTSFYDQTDFTNLIQQSEDEPESTGVAVRRAVVDSDDPSSDEPLDNADTEMYNARSQGIRNENIMNFVSDPKVEIGDVFEKRKIFNEIDRLPRNQRDYQEVKTLKDIEKDLPSKNQIIPNTKTKIENVSDTFNNINENEIIDSKEKFDSAEELDESFNMTNQESDFSEENRSGIGRKSIKSGGTSNDVVFGNELKINSKLKKPLEDTVNVIEDSVKIPIHKNVVEAVKSMRKKRNVNENEDISSGNRANDFKPSEDINQRCWSSPSQIKIKTRIGITNITEEYCDNCDSYRKNCTYNIPLSQYMPDESISIIFSSPVKTCSSIIPYTPCPVVNEIDQEMLQSSTNPSIDSTNPTQHQISIDVKSNKISYHRFRLKIGSGQETDLCEESRSEAGKSFVEINLKIYRVCDG
eukprot:GFUD01050507.1.p1 GENE.GFUD01050507.1~~GFUD01050507.1.p1  ORF type:complete len:1315 (+),score=258.40 GFUD01050507.1:90-4034(+)